MAKKQQRNAELHAAAKLRLQDFLLASVNETGEGLPTDIREAITTIINCKRLTYRYMLFVGLLVAVTDKKYHPRCLQVKAKNELVVVGKEAFDARSLCKKVVVPFEKLLLKGKLGGSGDPYVSNPARLPMVLPGNDVKGSYDKQLLGQLYDVLEFANGADDAMRKKLFSHAYAQVLKRPACEMSLLECNAEEPTGLSSDMFFDFLEAHTQGVSAVVILAAFFRQYYGKGTKVVVHPILRVSAYAGMLFNGMGRPIDLSRPCQTLPASMGGNKTPIIDTRLLKDPSSPDWLKLIHIKAIKGIDLSKTKVPQFMRRITVSEAAALQGFPKDFEFCGSQCDKYKQIGNSVPPPFAYAIARSVLGSLK